MTFRPMLLFHVVRQVSELKCLQGTLENSIQKRSKVLNSMSSNDNKNQYLTCIKKAQVLNWEQNPLTERYRGNLLISILILDSQPGIQAFLSHSFVIEPSARGKIAVSVSVQTAWMKQTRAANQISRVQEPLIFPNPTEWPEISLNQFLHYFPFNFLQKGRNTKSYLK